MLCLAWFQRRTACGCANLFQPSHYSTSGTERPRLIMLCRLLSWFSEDPRCHRCILFIASSGWLQTTAPNNTACFAACSMVYTSVNFELTHYFSQSTLQSWSRSLLLQKKCAGSFWTTSLACLTSSLALRQLVQHSCSQPNWHPETLCQVLP